LSFIEDILTTTLSRKTSFSTAGPTHEAFEPVRLEIIQIGKMDSKLLKMLAAADAVLKLRYVVTRPTMKNKVQYYSKKIKTCSECRGDV
jgi:hypothetical protein